MKGFLIQRKTEIRGSNAKYKTGMKELKREPLSSGFSTDESLISASSAPHCSKTGAWVLPEPYILSHLVLLNPVRFSNTGAWVWPSRFWKTGSWMWPCWFCPSPGDDDVPVLLHVDNIYADCPPPDGSEVSALHVHGVYGDPVTVNRQVAMMCLCGMFILLMLAVHCPLAMMCLCCLFMVLMLTVTVPVLHQVVMMCLCCMLTVLTVTFYHQVHVLHVHNVDADPVAFNCQVTMMCLCCCMCMMLSTLSTTRWQWCVCIACSRCWFCLCPPPGGNDVYVLHVHDVDSDCRPPGGNDVSVLHAYGADSVIVHHQVAVMCLWCRLVVLMLTSSLSTTRWQWCVCAACSRCWCWPWGWPAWVDAGCSCCGWASSSSPSLATSPSCPQPPRDPSAMPTIPETMAWSSPVRWGKFFGRICDELYHMEGYWGSDSRNSYSA